LAQEIGSDFCGANARAMIARIRPCIFAGLWPLLLLQPAGLGLVSAAEADGQDLRPWVNRMRAKQAHGGDLQTLAKEHKVVVVMTTIPPRINRIEPVLDAMLAQTWPIESLYLSVPYRYNRTGERYVIPTWLRAKAGVRLVRCEDMGPGTHLLNGLRLERDPWAFLVVVDDDHIYSPTLVEDLMRAALAHPGSAVAAQGFLSVPGLEIAKDSPRYLHDQGFAAGPVLVSYLGVVYQRGFFDDSIFDYSAVSPNCRYQDDMWFSAHLAKKGIRRWVLGAALGVTELREMHLGPESLTYWEENRPRQVSEECNDSLLRLQADIWAWRRRLVLAVGGLPPWQLSSFTSGAAAAQTDEQLLLDRERAAAVAAAVPGSGDEPQSSLTASGEWGDALDVFRQLPRTPDLTYLCTQNAATEDAAGNDGSEGGNKERVLGSSFSLNGVLVAPSDACEAYASEPRVGQLLRDALRWEGDPDTVIVVGSLSDVAAGTDSVAPVADCAAEIFNAEGAPAGAKRAGSSGPELGGDAAGRLGSAHVSAPFCRMGGLAAVSVGAMSQIAGGRGATM